MNQTKGCAAVLAGGKSLRFGRDKAFADCTGIPLIEHILIQLKDCFDDILIIADDMDKYGYLGYPVIPDRLPGIGPLGGIHAALKEADNNTSVFITACDMPFISKALISSMRRILKTHPFDAVAGMHMGYLEPLHAFYSTSLISGIESFAGRNGRKISAFLENRDCYYMEEKDVVDICSHEKTLPFININTEEDFLKMKKILT